MFRNRAVSGLPEYSPSNFNSRNQTKNSIQLLDEVNGSLGFAPTRNCTHCIKIGFVVAGGGFYSYNISSKGINQIKKGKV